MNRTLVFDKAPQRIVSLVPSQTELLAELRLRENILGITKFCIHPEDLKQTTTIVGGTKQVHFNKIRDLNPDIILCNKEENTKEMVSELERLAPVHISDIRTIEDNLELIEQYGLLFDKQRESQQLSLKIKERYNAFQSEMKSYEWKSVGYFIWRKPYMVAGSDTFIDEMLSICKLKNVFAQLKGRYPEIAVEELPFMDALFLSSEPYPFTEKHVKELQQYTPAKILLVDGEFFSWYGSRILQAFDYFSEVRKSLNI